MMSGPGRGPRNCVGGAGRQADDREKRPHPKSLMCLARVDARDDRGPPRGDPHGQWKKGGGAPGGSVALGGGTTKGMEEDGRERGWTTTREGAPKWENRQREPARCRGTVVRGSGSNGGAAKRAGERQPGYI